MSYVIPRSSPKSIQYLKVLDFASLLENVDLNITLMDVNRQSSITFNEDKYERIYEIDGVFISLSNLKSLKNIALRNIPVNQFILTRIIEIPENKPNTKIP